jgi:hypothetical protein
MPRYHHHLEFAHRHSSDSLSTFNAYAAISRVHDLLYDLEELEQATNLLEQSGAPKGRRHSWFQITSYYPVALVTCLEWHARSRMVDLYTFKPSSIRAEDLKGQIGDKLLCEMVAQGVTVPQLMGAMTTVGSAEKYINTLQKVFAELKIDPPVRQLLNPIILSNTPERHDMLRGLFDYRNNLIHEIDFSIIGPWVVRSDIDISEARERCKMVLAAIEAIEKRFSEAAPLAFPNKLNSELLPEDELGQLDTDILELETEITEIVRARRSEDCIEPVLMIGSTL